MGKKSASRPSKRRRKSIMIDQQKLNQVRSLLGVVTETEAVDWALDVTLDVALLQREIEQGLSLLVGKGGFTDRFSSR